MHPLCGIFGTYMASLLGPFCSNFSKRSLLFLLLPRFLPSYPLHTQPDLKDGVQALPGGPHVSGESYLPPLLLLSCLDSSKQGWFPASSLGTRLLLTCTALVLTFSASETSIRVYHPLLFEHPPTNDRSLQQSLQPTSEGTANCIVHLFLLGRLEVLPCLSRLISSVSIIRL